VTDLRPAEIRPQRTEGTLPPGLIGIALYTPRFDRAFDRVTAILFFDLREDPTR
jgi:hypothetical protein